MSESNVECNVESNIERNYTCNVCNYTTTILFCYNKHLSTIKHNKKCGNIVDDVIRSKMYVCKYCNKSYKDKSNKARHFKKCLIEYNAEQEKQKYKELLEMERKKAKKTRIKDIQNQQKLLHDIITTVVKNAGQTNITNNTNNNYNVNNNVNNCPNFNYIKKNFKNPKTLEECLKPPLTQIEKDNITKTNPTVGCEYLIQSRCIGNMELDERPLHNIDSARNKFAVFCGEYPNKKWVSKDGKYIVGKFIPLIASQYKEKLNNAVGDECLLIAKELHDLQTIGKKKIVKSIADQTYIKNTLPNNKIKDKINVKDKIKEDSDRDIDSEELEKVHDKLVKNRIDKNNMYNSLVELLNTMSTNDCSDSDSDHCHSDSDNCHSDSDGDYYNEL
jgi:hypothetical protein